MFTVGIGAGIGGWTNTSVDAWLIVIQ